MTKSYSFNPTYITGISFISALGGYLFGFDFAVIAGALPFLKEQFGFNEVQEGLATATLAFGCILGCIVAGTISERFGRKKRPHACRHYFLWFIAGYGIFTQ